MGAVALSDLLQHGDEPVDRTGRSLLFQPVAVQPGSTCFLHGYERHDVFFHGALPRPGLFAFTADHPPRRGLSYRSGCCNIGVRIGQQRVDLVRRPDSESFQRIMFPGRGRRHPWPKRSNISATRQLTKCLETDLWDSCWSHPSRLGMNSAPPSFNAREIKIPVCLWDWAIVVGERRHGLGAKTARRTDTPALF